ncbi:hypothetical protein ACEZCY_36275 [Streptacidiphilus sp. N1-12]|uniref:Integral membrane protein n=2 Tax=Streptacidiphilus alkalitolerans TaxID=3342712 RepID=A0ABV6VLR0_9ACTN
MQTSDSEIKKDLRATAHTARELGPEYEDEVLDGFLQRLDQRLDAHIAVRVRRELGRDGAPAQAPAARQQQRNWGLGIFQYVSLVAAIPLSAIGANFAQAGGLVIVWSGIVGLNFVQARSQRYEERHRDDR